jgi:uncharacterized protein DUF4260
VTTRGVPQTIAIDATVRRWLRIEGLAALMAGVAIYGSAGGSWLLLIPLLLVPDTSMAGYLGGPRLGAWTYNLVHQWAAGLAVLAIGVWAAADWAVLLGALLIAHVGMDRALGYGLKYPTAFQMTHLGRIGARRTQPS